MLLQPGNLIILDEPTNHLDMRSKAVLMDALLDYEGSIVVVSHDRDFLDPLVTKVAEFRKGMIRTFPGNVSEYLERVEGLPGINSGDGKTDDLQTSAKDRKRKEAEERQARYERTRPLKIRLEKMERTIEEKERRKAEIEGAMADPGFYGDGEHVREVTAEYKEIEKELTEAYYRWNDLTKDLENAERMTGG
jgi:ATP-binding cassette subfamily F protein 3